MDRDFLQVELEFRIPWLMGDWEIATSFACLILPISVVGPGAGELPLRADR